MTPLQKTEWRCKLFLFPNSLSTACTFAPVPTTVLDVLFGLFAGTLPPPQRCQLVLLTDIYNYNMND